MIQDEGVTSSFKFMLDLLSSQLVLKHNMRLK